MLFRSERLFGNKDKTKNITDNFVPSSVRLGPIMAKCGYTEIQAKEKFKDITTYGHNGLQFEELLLDKPFPYTLKVVCKKDEHNKETVVGMHGIGKNMDEIISGCSIAMNKGLLKEDLVNYIPVSGTTFEDFCNAISL